MYVSVVCVNFVIISLSLRENVMNIIKFTLLDSLTNTKFSYRPCLHGFNVSLHSSPTIIDGGVLWLDSVYLLPLRSTRRTLSNETCGLR